MGSLQPMNIFLRQEIDQMQRVIALVRTTLTDLKLAIDGTIVMSENLRDALDCMYDARIPARWKKVGWEYWLKFSLSVSGNLSFFLWPAKPVLEKTMSIVFNIYGIYHRCYLQSAEVV